MTTLADRSRVPAGVRTGGQFATEARTESDVHLDEIEEPTRDWGALTLAEGSRTPWGPAQNVYDIAPGIAEVSCAGHGGIKLSKERNREVPPALRNASGWYEEDCEAAIPMWAFHEEYAAHRQSADHGASDMGDPGYVLMTSAARVREWFPDAWTKATGQTVTAEQSRIVAEREFAAAHAGDHITLSASRDADHPGMVRVTATPGGERPTMGRSWADVGAREFLVPEDEYETRGRFGFVVDPARHADVTPPPPPPKPKAKRHHPDVTAVRARAAEMTPAAENRVARDLAQRWRLADGSVTSLAQMLATEGVTGRSATMFSGDTSVTYYLQQHEHEGDRSGTVLRVSKATWDAVADQVPDSRTAGDIASLEVHRAQAAVEKAQANPDLGAFYGDTRLKARAALEKAKARLEKATAERARVRDEEKEGQA
ncbi:hypothetical protein [Cellulosimicrobium sp. Marseille-Q4280]|uniref:DUF7007 domain-containing protein n=1 Tax=Cellulosimicrobium sp. Marseille-Q4280 TaxID=2937992 RepID=UPI00203AFD88|nr:hypothetical protein [Cellulosimicrobium sp. Marseille-Q4280]